MSASNISVDSIESVESIDTLESIDSQSVLSTESTLSTLSRVSTVSTLLSTLVGSGFALSVDGGALVVSPGRKLTDELGAAIAANKAALVALVTERDPRTRIPSVVGDLRAWLESGRLRSIPTPFTLGPGITLIDIEKAVRAYIHDVSAAGNAQRGAAEVNLPKIHSALSPFIEKV